jgi:hypothetical protein
MLYTNYKLFVESIENSNDNNFTRKDFEQKWFNIVKTGLSEFSNIHPYDLTMQFVKGDKVAESQYVELANQLKAKYEEGFNGPLKTFKKLIDSLPEMLKDYKSITLEEGEKRFAEDIINRFSSDIQTIQKGWTNLEFSVNNLISFNQKVEHEGQHYTIVCLEPYKMGDNAPDTFNKWVNHFNESLKKVIRKDF